MMEGLLRDIGLAVRGLRRNPGFAAVAILTLALGIGATTTVFSVVYGVLLRALPFSAADRLVEIVQLMPDTDTGGTHRAGLTSDQFLNLQEHATLLHSVGIFGAHAARTLTGIPVPARLNGAGFTAELFDGLGVQPLVGRTLRREDSEPGADPVVVLSEPTWRTYFGRSESILETRITLNDVPTRVVGVMPEAFTFPSLATESMNRNSAGEIEDAPEFWVPGGRFERIGKSSGFSIFQAHAVLKPGVTYEQALAEVQSLIGPLPDNKVLPVELINARAEMAKETSRPLAIFQFGMVLVLLIACVNVVNLLLTRAAGRRRELAVRLALGATRSRVVREGTAESIVLSLIGGALGCLLAHGLIAGLRTLPPHIFPRLREIHVDGTVLLFALGLSLLTGLSVGLLSALRVTSDSVMSQLRPIVLRGSAAMAGFRLRPSSLLVVAEIAATVVLLTAGGLLVNSFVRLASVDLGYDPRDLVSLQVSLPKARYGTAEAHERFYREFSNQLRGLPGVAAVAATNSSLLYSQIGFDPLLIDGTRPVARTEISIRRLSPDFFRTLRIPLVEGRELTDDDWSPVAAKVIVNQAFARAHFPNTSPIGHRIDWSERKGFEIIGVAADSRQRPDGEIQHSFYLPIDAGGFLSNMVLLIRSDRETGDIVTAARAILARIDPQVAAYDAASVAEILKHASASPRLYGAVAVSGALLALALSAIGLYGVLAYSVGSRTHEFGIRIALGAEAGAVRWQVLRQGLVLAVIGLALGLAGAYTAAQTLSSLLFGITPADLTTFAVAACLLLVTAVAACLVPSIRATRVDPVVALRAE
jgi:putative ABC transport system permease protein